jgi:hypothetical protein
MLEIIKGLIKNGQSRETGNIKYVRHKTKKNKNKKYNSICVGHQHTQDTCGTLVIYECSFQLFWIGQLWRGGSAHLVNKFTVAVFDSLYFSCCFLLNFFSVSLLFWCVSHFSSLLFSFFPFFPLFYFHFLCCFDVMPNFLEFSINLCLKLDY